MGRSEIMKLALITTVAALLLATGSESFGDYDRDAIFYDDFSRLDPDRGDTNDVLRGENKQLVLLPEVNHGFAALLCTSYGDADIRTTVSLAPGGMAEPAGIAFWSGGLDKFYVAARSSRSTPAVGTITGTCKREWRTIYPRSTCSFLPCSATWQQRGLWERVLVVMCGEFSRTPKLNDGGNGGPPMSMGAPGRDHWGNAMFCLLGGGGVQGGRVVGATTRKGDVPKDRPVTPADLHATIDRVLGADPRVSFHDHAGRPVPAIDQGEAIGELF